MLNVVSSRNMYLIMEYNISCFFSKWWNKKVGFIRNMTVNFRNQLFQILIKVYLNQDHFDLIQKTDFLESFRMNNNNFLSTKVWRFREMNLVDSHHIDV